MQAHQLQSDIVLMDLTMPRLNGIEATRQIKRQMPRIRVLGLSMHAASDMAGALREAEACSYLAKSAGPEALIAAIQGCCGRNGSGS